ncbi:hypothetical protein BB558_005164 [Smittium angustum]|uniref:MTOR-associated protein MEAK7 n=1 Tax=Smittium angustum TaxID=133377 RepID=A0A2U1J187_SMIAN|nr:hypothetical protein BB558_006222 [Smittium angustum]PVZ98830.1 hypothetical protein BB558_005164 [Smittium angustum]
MGNSTSNQNSSVADLLSKFQNKIERDALQNSFILFNQNKLLEFKPKNELLIAWIKFVSTSNQSKSNTNILETEYYQKAAVLYIDTVLNIKSIFEFYKLFQYENNSSIYRFVETLVLNAISSWSQSFPSLSKNENSIFFQNNTDSSFFYSITKKLVFEFLQLIEAENNTFGEQSELTFEQNYIKWKDTLTKPTQIGYNDFSYWWRKSPKITTLFKQAFLNILLIGYQPSLVDLELITSLRKGSILCPSISNKNTIFKKARLMDPYIGWFIQRELPRNSRHEWQCIYSSASDGHSWNSFVKSIENIESILVLVSVNSNRKINTGSSIVGAYFDEKLSKFPSWKGNKNSLLFSFNQVPFSDECSLNSDSSWEEFLKCAAVYHTSGINENYQYFNYGTSTLPNGLGMGGQLNYFGLWIDSSFSTGHSFSTATFANSNPLTPSNEFTFESIEVYSVQKLLDNEKGFNQSTKNQKSAVSANPDAVALLEMANKTVYSKDFAENLN